MAANEAAYLQLPASWQLTANQIRELQDALNAGYVSMPGTIIVLPPGSRAETNGLEIAAHATHEMYTALTRAGFREEQALQIVMHQLTQLSVQAQES